MLGGALETFYNPFICLPGATVRLLVPAPSLSGDLG